MMYLQEAERCPIPLRRLINHCECFFLFHSSCYRTSWWDSEQCCVTLAMSTRASWTPHGELFMRARMWDRGNDPSRRCRHLSLPRTTSAFSAPAPAAAATWELQCLGSNHRREDQIRYRHERNGSIWVQRWGDQWNIFLKSRVLSIQLWGHVAEIPFQRSMAFTWAV